MSTTRFDTVLYCLRFRSTVPVLLKAILNVHAHGSASNVVTLQEKRECIIGKPQTKLDVVTVGTTRDAGLPPVKLCQTEQPVIYNTRAVVCFLQNAL